MSATGWKTHTALGRTRRRPPNPAPLTGPFSHCRPSGSPPDTDQLPAVHLTHAEAQAYCQWAGGRLPTAAEWRTAGFTELRSQPPTPWVRGTTSPWTTGHSPQGANTGDPDPRGPRRARARHSGRSERPARHGRQCVGMGGRCAWRRAAHDGRVLVVSRLANARGCRGLEACGLLCGVHRLSLRVRPGETTLRARTVRVRTQCPPNLATCRSPPVRPHSDTHQPSHPSDTTSPGRSLPSMST